MAPRTSAAEPPPAQQLLVNEWRCYDAGSTDRSCGPGSKFRLLEMLAGCACQVVRLLKGESRCRSATGGRAAAAAARAGAETRYTLLLSVNIARSQFVTSPGLRQTPDASAAAQNSSSPEHAQRPGTGSCHP